MNKEMFSEHLLIYVKNASDEAKSLVEFTKDSGMKKLREYFASYISDVPTDNSTFTILCSTYPDRIEDIKQAKSFLTIMGKHISGLYGGLSDKESVLLSLEAVSEEVQTHFNLSLEDVGEVEEQKINESHKSVESVTKGTYYKVEFEVLDITKVPKEFTKLVVDNEKVNAWKKENAQAITEEGKTIAGIKFTGELKVRG